MPTRTPTSRKIAKNTVFQSGFTLIEALVYAGICSLFLLAVVSVFGTAFVLYHNTDRQAESEESQLFISEKINRQVAESATYSTAQNLIAHEPWHNVFPASSTIATLIASPSVLQIGTSSVSDLQITLIENAAPDATWALNYYGLFSTTETK